MNLLHSPLLARAGLGLWCLGWLVVCGLLLTPLSVRGPEGSDLAAHFLVFGAMAFGAVTFCRRPLTLLGCAGLTAAGGGALEAAQSLVPYRTFSIADLVADVLGVAAGFALALLVLQLVIRPALPFAQARSGG